MFEYEFIEEQIEEFGNGFIESLIAKGFKPVLTDKGWKWIQNPRPTVLTDDEAAYRKSLM